MLKNEKIDLIVNTTEGRQSIADSSIIRRLALAQKVCYTTTLAGGEAFCIAMRYGPVERVRRLQDLHRGLASNRRVTGGDSVNDEGNARRGASRSGVGEQP